MDAIFAMLALAQEAAPAAQESFSWGNVLFMLLVRFVAVFVVLGVLQVSIYISGAVVSGIVGRPQDGSASPP